MTATAPDHAFGLDGSNRGCPGRRLLVVCDFDGTVCTVDLGNEFFDRFAGDWEAIDRAYAGGEVGSRAAYGRIAPLFRTNEAQTRDFILRNERLDPHFPEFLAFCRERRIELKIVSDGLDFYIEAVLRKHGLDVEFYSNRLLFLEDDRIGFDFPPANPQCGRCGTCKRSLLDRFRLEYDGIIYIGDGYSDLCAARTADRVFAKGVLYEKYAERGTPCLRYDDFGDIRSIMEQGLVIDCST